MSQRANRRHHRERVINKFKKIYKHVWDSTDQPESVIDGWSRKTAGRGSIGCGCWCCSNPRRSQIDGHGGLTIQEQKSLEDFQDQLKDIR